MNGRLEALFSLNNKVVVYEYLIIRTMFVNYLC